MNSAQITNKLADLEASAYNTLEALATALGKQEQAADELRTLEQSRAATEATTMLQVEGRNESERKANLLVLLTSNAPYQQLLSDLHTAESNRQRAADSVLIEQERLRLLRALISAYSTMSASAPSAERP